MWHKTNKYTNRPMLVFRLQVVIRGGGTQGPISDPDALGLSRIHLVHVEYATCDHDYMV